MRRHLLVTNDFPPKTGGIQSYLWELWRRLPPDTFTVMTTPHRGASRFDAEQRFPVVRSPEPVLLPYPWLGRRIDAAARAMDADLVVIDPAVPLGAIGHQLTLPYGVVVHGAEVTVPGRLPLTRQILGSILRRADPVIAAGRYPAAEAERAAGRLLPVHVIPPGVDTTRFRPLDEPERRAVRRRLGLPEEALLVLGLSRLVPRKGFDALVAAMELVGARHPDTVLVISGVGRDAPRLRRAAAGTTATVRFLGRVPEEDKPALYAACDVFCMPCRVRWAGLEQEGFGIVFAEAAAAGLPQVAGRSGGAHEAVVHGETGLVLDEPKDVAAVAAALCDLLGDAALRTAMGRAARLRAERELSYDVLVGRLEDALS